MSQEYYDECMRWLALYLFDHVALRSVVSSNGNNTRVNLYAESVDGNLLCFSYHSSGHPSSKTFDLEIVDGMDMGEQLQGLMEKWKHLGFRFWTAPTQAVTCEFGPGSITTTNSYSLEMLFAYHRLLGWLESMPVYSEISPKDVPLAHDRLKGFLKEQALKLNQAIDALAEVARR